MTETLNNSFNLIRASLESFIASLPALIIALLAFVIIYRISAPIAGVVREPLRRTKRSLSLQIIIFRLGDRFAILLYARCIRRIKWGRDHMAAPPSLVLSHALSRVQGWITHVDFGDTWGLREYIFRNRPIRPPKKP